MLFERRQRAAQEGDVLPFLQLVVEGVAVKAEAVAEHVADGRLELVAAGQAAATAPTSATGWSKLSLPSSASLATMVEATPFDTDAQRNTVSGVTFSPEPSSVSP